MVPLCFGGQIFQDVACHRRILNLTVKCSYAGCPWTGELRDVEKHQPECLFKVLECPNSGCKEKLIRRDLDDHKIRECIWRKVSCEYCGGSFIMRNKQQHHNVCQKFPVECTNNCGLRDIPREKHVAHILDDCPFTEVHCKYKNLGCQEMFQRREIKSHLESHMESHLNLALCSLEITQNQVKDQSQQIERLTSTFDNQSQQMEQQSQQLNDQSQQIDRLLAKNVEQSQQMEQQSQQLNDQSQQLNDQSQQLNDQSQRIDSLTSTVQGLVQQMERLKGQDQYQAMPVNKMTNEAKGGPNKKGATNVRVKGGDTIKQGFKPKSINDIEVGMKVLFEHVTAELRIQGTVKYVGYVSSLDGDRLGVEIDPDQELPRWHHGNDGTIGGKRYFTCASGGGIFIRFKTVVECYRWRL